MANAQRGEVGVEVNGKRYILKPTFNALCDLEELTGQTFGEIAVKAGKGSAVAVRQLVWAYLQEYHAEEITTVKDAGRWILDAGGLPVVKDALQRLIDRNTESSTENPREAQAGVGASSTFEPVGTV